MDHITSSGQRLFHTVRHISMAARVSVIMIVLTMAGCATVALAEKKQTPVKKTFETVTIKSHTAHE